MKILGALAAALLVLAAVLVVNTLRISKPERADLSLVPADNTRIDANEVAKHLAEIIKLPTVSHQDATTTLGYRALAAAIQRQYPDALVTPTLMFGATDSRHFQSLSDAIYRFAPFTLNKADVSSIHGTNERIAVADLEKEVLVYRSLLRAAAGQASKRADHP